MGNVENKLRVEDSSIHDWYRFVLSFPPHLVQQYLETFVLIRHRLFWIPFAGQEQLMLSAKSTEFLLGA